MKKFCHRTTVQTRSRPLKGTDGLPGVVDTFTYFQSGGGIGQVSV